MEGSRLNDHLIKNEFPQITPYLLTGKGPFPVMIVCPGGGYVRHADHEGEPVAQWLNRIGISAIVLHYRVAPHRYPEALHDAQMTIQMTRHNQEKWNIDPNRVGIMGFSAGGHVAASAGIDYKNEDKSAEEPIYHHSSRPDLMVLGYPVITMGMPLYVHEGSKLNLLGKQAGLSLVRKLSLEKQVTADTPPTFLWHTADDSSVPVENSMMFARSLGKYKIPYALHIFESGKHGLGLAKDHPAAKEWTKICETWLKKRKFIKGGE